MLPAIAAIVSTLLANNLPKVAQAVVDKGIDVVSDKLGVSLKPDMSAEEIRAVRAEAMKHEEFVTEQDNKNTADARAMQGKALEQDDLFSKRFIYYLATFWSVVVVAYVAAITFVDIPAANVRFADTILGFLLGTVVATVMNFFFGSSNSSKQKTDQLTKALLEKQ